MKNIFFNFKLKIENNKKNFFKYIILSNFFFKIIKKLNQIN